MSLLERLRVALASGLARLGLSGREAAAGLLLFLVSFFGSIALTGALLVRLPPDYLVNDAPPDVKRMTLRERALRIGRHALGVLLIVMGVVMSFPGVPGQGVLTIVAGLFISELPGTRALVRRLFRSSKILSTVNNLRARYGHPPLIAPEGAAKAPPERG